MQNDSCLEILFIYRNVTRVQPDGSLVKSSPLLQRDPLQMSCAHQSPRLTHINCSCISWQYVCVYKLNLDTGCVQPSSLSKCLEGVTCSTSGKPLGHCNYLLSVAECKGIQCNHRATTDVSWSQGGSHFYLP